MKKLAALLLALVATPAAAQVQGVMLDAPVELPDFGFTNELGEEFTDKDLEDQWTIVMFGFLSCPDVCPFTLGNLEAAISETGLRVRPDNVPNVVFISVDPERDAAFVSEYAKFFHPEFESFTGDREQIDTLIEATDSFYRLLKPDHTGHYEVQHSSSVSVIAPDGTLRAKLQPPFDPGATAEFLARLQITYRKELSN
ncbi:SCO family protein [Roseobacter sinensis]|uniref:SCO family protein n=1 Tax=Roseobacter sinensis TaxID=2931391 RepID=A0ABT3BIA0_9RHOB|nr:SCO family protein [Roseobacter sp. WL0113]MCV3273297.1 SCO family protein [Roseobacter sp. WL0113]